MTFLEAAIEILKREKKPLPSKELARLALKSNLLTVVGRDPDATMQEQLETAIRRGHVDLVRSSFGTYSLRSLSERSQIPKESGGASPGDAGAGPGRLVDEEIERERPRGGREGVPLQSSPPKEHPPVAPKPQPADIGDRTVDDNENKTETKSDATPAAPAQAEGAQDAAKPAEPPARNMAFADAVLDVLRGSSEGRPMHFRQVTDIALKRRLVRGEAADLWRLLRSSVVRDQRLRDSDGLRTRVKHIGQGQYLLLDKKLEPELLTAEKELLDRLNRTREATRVALRRRIRAMPPSAFELLMRLLLERLGMVAADLIKRAEGVAYYAGTLTRGSRAIKTLAAIRAGEGEITPNAVGELRAGVRLRGYDEGILLSSGRASAAAVTEVNAAPGLDLYDHEALTDLLIRHQIGVRRLSLPIDYIDTDLFAELLEPV